MCIYIYINMGPPIRVPLTFGRFQNIVFEPTFFGVTLICIILIFKSKNSFPNLSQIKRISKRIAFQERGLKRN